MREVVELLGEKGEIRMRIAALSDIHSNGVALQACLKDMKKMKVQGVVLLGDYVSDCPDPLVTIDMIHEVQKEYKTWCIRGNREEYFMEYDDGLITDWKYNSYKGSLLYTYEQLNQEVIAWFRSLPNTMILEIPGTKAITLAHGSPVHTRELLDEGMENTKRCLEELDTEYLLCGHTHRQCIYRYCGKTLFNPGSVGVAIGVPEQAHYMILEWDGEEWIGEQRSVSYEYESLRESFLNSELMEQARVWPRAILKSIETGTNYGPLCAKRAYELALENKEDIQNMVVPERYWEMAARELEICQVTGKKNSDR